MTEELISVIVPIYNAENLLWQTLESICKQSYTCFEVLLIDDGSTDKTAAICKEFTVRDSRFRYLRKENSGVADTRNVGLENVNGAYIAFVDADDTIDINFLSVLYRNLVLYDVQISFCNISIVQDHQAQITSYSNKVKVQLFTDTEFLQLQDRLVACALWNKLYKKEVFKDIRFPSGMHFEDNFVFHDLYGGDQYKLVFINDNLYYYYQSENSITRNIFSLKKYEDHINGLYRRQQFFKNKKMNDLAKATGSLMIEYIGGSYLKWPQLTKHLLTTRIIRENLLHADIHWKTKFLMAVKTIFQR